MQSVFVKALAVINSCETLEQLLIADKYLNLIYTSKYYMNINSHFLLKNILNDRINKTR